MQRVLIVPGLNNSGPHHWQTQWEKRLPLSHRIELRDWATPNLTQWVNAIEIAIDRFGPMHIVAHSFGTLAAAVVAGKSPAAIKSVLLVAPADPNKFRVCDRLPATRLRVSGVVIGSLTDPWFKWGGVQALARQWGFESICAGDVGHINVDSGHGHWPEGWLTLERLHRAADERYCA